MLTNVIQRKKKKKGKTCSYIAPPVLLLYIIVLLSFFIYLNKLFVSPLSIYFCSIISAHGLTKSRPISELPVSQYITSSGNEFVTPVF